MAISEHESEDNYSKTEGSSDSDYESDRDPSYSIIEDTQIQLSNLSIHKKSKSRIGKALDIERDTEENELKVLMESGNLEKLKVEQCKVYLRKNGLRLTGNKATLIQRLKEHQEILNGEAEKKYPVSCFVMNCKGDACLGDVVMFEQNVYEMFNIASRSASGPSLGKRIVVGRIVNDSYGAAKQQHTFTIEVLWSKGERPLRPLQPLLIKGRNLYRLKTMRQRWEDEDKRRNVLIEKHSRGSLARDAREIRVQRKESRKILGENRVLKEKIHRNQINSNLATKQGIQAQQSGSSVAKVAPEPQQSSLFGNFDKTTVRKLSSNIDPTMGYRAHMSTSPRPLSGAFANRVNIDRPVLVPLETQKPTILHEQPMRQTENAHRRQFTHYMDDPSHFPDLHRNGNFGSRPSSFNMNHRYPPVNDYSRTENYSHVHPSTRPNRYHQQQQACKYFAQGRCNFGDNCKFLHDSKENYGQRRGDRPCYYNRLERQQF
ncbi:zinc finger CCCH domain-containing protein 62-like [Mercurialis annua]|uniref:zinc finger CCCH domain-containing protein 62-like n=1 Tax=Mercurialis annua TaxID=3986 RepID=UPI00215FA3FD|nr:zinc finger CCCH domain-containing protein 62-like [Mercurialis annua]